MSVVVAPTETRPGLKTTEFWLVILSNLIVLFGDAVGVLDIPAKYAALGLLILNGAYTIARGLAKVGVPNVPAVVEGDPEDTRAHDPEAFKRFQADGGYAEGGLLGLLLVVCLVVLLVVLIGHLPLWLLLIIFIVLLVGAVA